MSKEINDLDSGGTFQRTANIEAQRAVGGPGSSVRWSFNELFAAILASDVPIDDTGWANLVGNDPQVVFDNLDTFLSLFSGGNIENILTNGNNANGLGIEELLEIRNVTNDFELIAPNGVDFYFGTSPGGILGLDAVADQIFFTANQWAALSSDSNMYLSMDIDTQLIELSNQFNYLRITDFDIEVGAPILGYSTTSQMVSYVNGQIESQVRIKFVKGRTTAALPACTANAGFTTLTCNSNQAFSGLTTETDGLTYGLLQDILVMDESDPKRWGIYQLSQPGSISTPWILTRRSDANPGTDLTNMVVFIEQGARFKNTSWRQTTLNPVFGTDNLNFVPFADNIVRDSSGGYWRIDVSTLGVLSTTAI